MLRVAAAQFAPAFADKRANLERILELMRRAAAGGAGLVVFPECALTGYCFSSREPAYANSEPVPGPSTERIAQLARRDNLHVVVGLLERAGERFYNSAALVGPQGVVAVHRKAHLPLLGVDRYVAPGDLPIRPADTPLGRIGMLICFEASLPEPSRALKLHGAQLIVLPTNWPARGAQTSCEHLPTVRALENHVNFVAVNRVGREGEFDFLGGSSIVDCDARTLARADGSEALLMADLDLPAADRNRVVNRPGEYELDRIATRRPELY
jgi:predicted amidohydrolase